MVPYNGGEMDDNGDGECDVLLAKENEETIRITPITENAVAYMNKVFDGCGECVKVGMVIRTNIPVMDLLGLLGGLVIGLEDESKPGNILKVTPSLH